MEKVLTVDYQKCTGCRLCELVCSVTHDGISNPARSRIKIVKWEDEGLYVPMICQQCEDAPCKNVCPVGAISRDADLRFPDHRPYTVHRVPFMCERLPVRGHEL